MTTFFRDLQYGLRQLRKSPGFTLVCVLTIALGIGANTAVFSVMNAVLLRMLPVAHPEQVVYLNTTGLPYRATSSGNGSTSFSFNVYDTLRRDHPGLSEVIAYVPLSFGNTIGVRYGASPEVAEGDMVSGNFFSGLGVPMARGRGFTRRDEEAHTQSAVLSYDYWRRRFLRDPEIVGQTIHIKGVPFTIVGIAGEGFEGVEEGSTTDLWIPLQTGREFNAWGVLPGPDGKNYLNRPEWWCLRLMARLAPGTTKQQALARLQPLFQQAAYLGIGAPGPGEKPPVLSLSEAKNFPGAEQQFGEPLHIMMGMVALVLLIALSNVAMLLMARNTARAREFSLRISVGAGRERLFRQLLTEGLLLTVAGGLLAWPLAFAATHVLAAWSQIETSLAPDKTVLLFTGALLTLTAIVFGVAPLRTATASGPGLVLKTSNATAGTGKGAVRFGRMIIAAQIALCVTLLVGAGLLVRTLRNLEDTPLGLEADNLLLFGINPEQAHSAAESIAFYQELLRRLRTLPGVADASAVRFRPGSGWSNNFALLVDGKVPPNAIDGRGEIRNNVAASNFFHTLGVPVVAGRDFSDADLGSSPKVAIINETFAKRYLPGEDPIGHRVGGKDAKNQLTIVGVVKDHKYTTIQEQPVPMEWDDALQRDTLGAMNIALRTYGDPLAMLPAVRKVVQQIDPNLPLEQPMTQRAQFETTIAEPMLFARLAGCFGLLAALLVATGLYGTLAFRVANRTVEIGVRMALGARREEIVKMVVQDSLLVAAAGVAAGLPIAALLAHALASELYGVKPWDWLTYAAAIAGVAMVALAASLVPAQRAAGVDPMHALRSE